MLQSVLILLDPILLLSHMRALPLVAAREEVREKGLGSGEHLAHEKGVGFPELVCEVILKVEVRLRPFRFQEFFERLGEAQMPVSHTTGNNATQGVDKCVRWYRGGVMAAQEQTPCSQHSFPTMVHDVGRPTSCQTSF